MPFKKGNPGGPGRPAGSRNQATQILDEIGRDGSAKILQSVMQKAEAGDVRAAAVVLARTWPHRRGRPVSLDLPAVDDAAGLAAAQAALIGAAARGEITPDEGASFTSMLENRRRILETVELEKRLVELEELRAEMERRQADDRR
jgi:hypothetical protein